MTIETTQIQALEEKQFFQGQSVVKVIAIYPSAPAGSDIIVAVELIDANGNLGNQRFMARCWLSDSATDPTLTASAPTAFSNSSGSVVLQTVVSRKDLWMVSNSSGVCALTITSLASGTWYLWVSVGETIAVSSIVFP